MKVLYVEDSRLDAELLCKELQQPGRFDILVAGSLQEGRERIDRDQGYDLVLVDMALPDGNGLELLSEIRKRALPLAVVVLTGSGDEESAVAALKAGADDYVVKSEGYLGRLVSTLDDSLARFRAESDRRSHPLRVLYAEPNADDVDLAVRHFSHHAPHIRLLTVTTAAEVLARLAASSPDTAAIPDVLLLDYRLPGMSALELIKAVRRMGAVDLPAVLITGHGSEEAAVQALRLGFADYLVKAPGYLFKLPGTLESVFSGAELLRERRMLQESEARFRHLVNLSPDGIAVHQDGEIVFVNPAGARILGAEEPEQLFGKAIRDVIHPDYWEAAGDRMQRMMKGEKGLYPVEDCYMRLDGTAIRVEVTAAPFTHRGAPAVQVVVRDITERKKTEEAVRNLEAQLSQAHKMEAVGRLAGGVAHDFNNMLNVILGYADLALERLTRADPLYADVDEIRQAAERSASLTRQLLAFARRQNIAPRALDLNAQVRQTEKMLQRLIGEDIELTFHPDPDLWTVNMDPSQVDQILANLAVNSRDAIAGVGSLIIETANVVKDEACGTTHAGLTPGEYVLLTLSDTGRGMDPETLERLFEPFFTTKAAGGGTGLGLATVYGIVKQNDGCVDVYSEPGHGTTFKIYLPRFDGKPDLGVSI